MSINSSYSAAANPVVVDTVQEHVVDTHGKTIIQQYHYHYYNTDPATDVNTQPKSQPDAIPSVVQPTPTKTQPIPKMAQSRFLTPAQVIDKLKLDGVRKSKLTLDQTIILSLFAGVFKGIAGSISMIIGGNNPEMQKNNPGAQQLMFGIVFPIGLTLTIMMGAELFTGNCMVLVLGLLSRKWATKKFIKHYYHFSKNILLSFTFNMIGAFLVSYFFVYQTHLMSPNDPDAPYWIKYAMKLAETKCSKTFGSLVLSGIICNMLVTMSIFIANAATSIEAKIIGLWPGITVFVACGWDHSVSNSFFIPLGMLYGANVSVSDFLIGNLLPVTIGNIIGGSFVIAGLMYFVNDFRAKNKKLVFESISKIWKRTKQASQSVNSFAMSRSISETELENSNEKETLI
ncbi:predicted protein [Naegleria gruberi]|uniref:Predicted protein n=1 Tax=Naegleria gruberi TaxID=5762 RepID=D2VHG1_NAEGR|nr:uncharacterized protein NAEGRDRAFT_68315 [Naegleria gruberi]EFC43581.1 predicted protein [Naegleria gruberi]|eukprot:XP_002676325.1 predicted protein [Naegleria gruberi strain NEG-M]